MNRPAVDLSVQDRVRALRQQLADGGKQAWEGADSGLDDLGLGAAARMAPRVISSGCLALDRRLPGGGFFSNQLVEWFADRPGSGVGWLAWQGAVRALRGDLPRYGLPARGPVTMESARKHTEASVRGEVIVIIDREDRFYPPAALDVGLSPSDLIVVRPQSPRDEIWAWDQALRAAAVAAVWGWMARIHPHDFRRLRLAAEQGNTLGMLLRPATQLRQASWADVQLRVHPLPTRWNRISEHSPHHALRSLTSRRWRIRITRCRGIPVETLDELIWEEAALENDHRRSCRHER